MKTHEGFSLRNSILILIIFLTLSSCSSEIDDLVVGEWKNSKNLFLITLNQDFDYVDAFSKPWKGSVIIDNESIKTDSLKLIIDNSFGGICIYSDSIGFSFYNNELGINYKNVFYTFQGSFTLNLTDGKFIADGIAVKDDKQLDIKVSIDAQHTYMKKDIQYEIKDGSSFLKYPLQELSFKDNGKLNCVMMDIDILNSYAGKWQIKSGKLNLNIDDAGLNEYYKYQISGGNTLDLIKDLEYNASENYSSIPETSISKLQYKTSFIKQ
jgi:hypothetical protein